MKKPVKYCIDIQKMCDIKGPLHTYFVDTNNIIIACNKLKRDFLEDTFNRKDIIGKLSINQLVEDANLTPAEACYRENPDILKSGLPRQSHSVWAIKGQYKLELLTIKIPVYHTDGKPLGVFVVSHFINKFSAQKALSLGLTKRETECLFYLLEGYRAKEIAKAIKLSPRTIEGYIDNMKNKLGCSTTSELLLIALQNEIKAGLSNTSPMNLTINTLNPLSNSMEDKSTFEYIPIIST